MTIRNILAVTALCAAATAAAQGFVYDATITGADGAPAAGESVALDFALTDASGATLYAEEHPAVVADAVGAVSAVVGEGTPTAGAFRLIDWSRDGLAMAVTMTRADGTVHTCTTPLGWTPAALGADEASSLTCPAEGGRWRLSVADDGTLATVFEPLQIIEIPKGYTKLFFHDEFDYTGVPDPRYWDYEIGYVRNGEMQYYSNRLENVRVADGALTLEVRADNWQDAEGNTHKVTSGSVHTQDRVKFTYGRVDIRARFTPIVGTWPGLWMMPNDSRYGTWPNSGEIDIMENVGFAPQVVHFTAHCAEQNSDHNSYHYSTTVLTPADWHVYSLVWTADKLEWYVDNKRKFMVKNNSSTWRGWPYCQDFYLILDHAFGGGWGGQQGVDLESLPCRMDIDYVRVFQ